MAYVGHAREEEADTVELLVAEWTKNGVLGQGTKEVRELIKQFTVVKDAVAWRPVASKVPATKQAGDEVENQAIMAWRLARRLLCLRRLDTTNVEAYKESIGARDEAIWTKRVGMEMPMWGRKLPQDILRIQRRPRPISRQEGAGSRCVPIQWALETNSVERAWRTKGKGHRGRWAKGRKPQRRH